MKFAESLLKLLDYKFFSTQKKKNVKIAVHRTENWFTEFSKPHIVIGYSSF